MHEALCLENRILERGIKTLSTHGYVWDQWLTVYKRHQRVDQLSLF